MSMVYQLAAGSCIPCPGPVPRGQGWDMGKGNSPYLMQSLQLLYFTNFAINSENLPQLSYVMGLSLARLHFSDITFSSKFLVLCMKLEGVTLGARLLPKCKS